MSMSNLKEAIYRANVKGVEKEIRNGVDLKPEMGDPPLKYAITSAGQYRNARKDIAYVSIINALIEAGADVNASDTVYSAAFNKLNSILQLLLNAGATGVNKKGYNGHTPVMWAWSSQPTLQTLIEAGANLNLKNDDGETVVLKICKSAHDHFISSLNMVIDAGADVNEPDNASSTPLMHASYNRLHKKGNINFIKALIMAGANINGSHRTHDCRIKWNVRNRQYFTRQSC